MNKQKTIELIDNDIRIEQIIYPSLWFSSMNDAQDACAFNYLGSVLTMGELDDLFLEPETNTDDLDEQEYLQTIVEAMINKMEYHQFLAFVRTPVQKRWSFTQSKWIIANDLDDLHKKSMDFREEVRGVA